MLLVKINHSNPKFVTTKFWNEKKHDAKKKKAA